MSIKDTFLQLFNENPKLMDSINVAVHQYWITSGEREKPLQKRTSVSTLDRQFRKAKKEYVKD